MPADNKPLTPLQQRVAREIVALIRRDNRPIGHHLSKMNLAREIGTSHNPVEAALAYLARTGIAGHERDRGYFLARSAQQLAATAKKLAPAGDDPLYRGIIDFRLSRRLPDTITEMDLIRTFGSTRNAVRKTLARIQQEGWIERRAGHGWEFLPLIDSVEAYDENYELRRIIEPAGVLSKNFAFVATEMEELKRQQRFMAEGGHREMTPAEWVDLNARFHETLARWSGNRFMLQTLKRVNQLRKVVEYRVTASDPALRARQTAEHLRILDAIENGGRKVAAKLLERHLEGARKAKVRPNHFVATAR